MDAEFQGRIFVRVAELLQRYFLRCVCRALCVVEVWALVNLNKLINATTAAVDPHVNWQCFWTHAHTASLDIVDTSPRHLKHCFFVRFLNSFRPNNDLASEIFMTSKLNVLSEHLRSRTHDVAHRGFNTAYDVEITVMRAVPINHLKLELLCPLKVIA